MAFKFPDKDPDEKLDYTVDWSRYLERDNLSIVSVVWKIQKADGSFTTFTENNAFQNDTLVTATTSTVGFVNEDALDPESTTATIILSGGEAGVSYTLLCEITTGNSAKTSAPIVTNRKIKIKVRERI